MLPACGRESTSLEVVKGEDHMLGGAAEELIERIVQWWPAALAHL